MLLIAKKWAHLLYPGHISMAKEKAALWADAINAKLGFDSKGCIMFVDGTEIQMCRPSIWQRLSFNGHKRFHSTGWQGLLAPCGIIVQLFGPYLGTYNDCKMLSLSRLMTCCMSALPLACAASRTAFAVAAHAAPRSLCAAANGLCRIAML